jgi:serine/threonine protein kinase
MLVCREREKLILAVLIEVQLLQGLSHPNLVSYRHVWLEDVQLNRFSPSVPCAFILQQYCNSGDLHQYIIGPTPALKSPKEQLKEQMRRRSRGQSDRPDIRSMQRKLSFEEIYSFFKDITSGLSHLHNANYIHRDLKPSNCLLHKDGNEFRCLISDFGEVQPENVVRKSTGSTGTISYCAPEVLRKDEHGRYGNFTTKSDIFSLGMILYFMCFGRLPYASANSIQEEFEDIDLLRAEISSWSGFRDERRERPELPNQLYEFLKRLLATRPSDRPSANEILTAIRTEKGLDNPSRSRNGSSGSLSGRIIQTLDSPMPPGTPVNGTFNHHFNLFRGLHFPEPSKRSTSSAYIEDATTSEASSPSSSPTSQLVIDPKSHTRSQSRSHSRHAEPLTPNPNISTPLLMPPPSTRLSRLQHRFSIYWHYSSTWASRNTQIFYLSFRFALFVLKFLSLTKPCAPLAAKESVLWPLMLLACTEAFLGNNIGWTGTWVLAMIHVIVLGCISGLGLGGGLCERSATLHDWRWTEE